MLTCVNMLCFFNKENNNIVTTDAQKRDIKNQYPPNSCSESVIVIAWIILFQNMSKEYDES